MGVQFDPMAPLWQRLAQIAYGPVWQHEVSQICGVTDRTVRNWSVGRGAPKDRDVQLIRAYCRYRAGVLLHLLDAAPMPSLNQSVKDSLSESLPAS